MSKTVYFVRHAKSSWDNPGLADINRPLNERGERDAPKMGVFLREKEGVPDFLISSPAERALATAKHFREAMGIGRNDLKIKKYLYHASPDELLHAVQELSEEITTAYVFAHNPGMTILANLFSKRAIDNVPTCGVVKIEFDVDTWEEVNADSGTLHSFYYPKKHLK